LSVEVLSAEGAARINGHHALKVIRYPAPINQEADEFLAAESLAALKAADEGKGSARLWNITESLVENPWR
jgi:hypothetical protein